MQESSQKAFSVFSCLFFHLKQNKNKKSMLTDKGPNHCFPLLWERRTGLEKGGLGSLSHSHRGEGCKVTIRSLQAEKQKVTFGTWQGYLRMLLPAPCVPTWTIYREPLCLAWSCDCPLEGWGDDSVSIGGSLFTDLRALELFRFLIIKTEVSKGDGSRSCVP